MAGAPQTERQAAARASREERDRARARKTERDETDPEVDRVELTDAVRTLKDNTQEEAQDDREEHPQYGAGGRLLGPPEERPRVDLKG
jgi:hypothetical protein